MFKEVLVIAYNREFEMFNNDFQYAFISKSSGFPHKTLYYESPRNNEYNKKIILIILKSV